MFPSFLLICPQKPSALLLLCAQVLPVWLASGGHLAQVRQLQYDQGSGTQSLPAAAGHGQVRHTPSPFLPVDPYVEACVCARARVCSAAGTVSLFRYPCCTPGAKGRVSHGHGSHISAAVWSADDRYVVTAGAPHRSALPGQFPCTFIQQVLLPLLGGTDQAILVWRRRAAENL